MTELSKNTESNNLAKPLLQAVFLVPYVPYYLRIFEPIYNKKYTLVGIIENELYCKETAIDDCFSFEIDENTFPILRPLSDFYDINAPAFSDTNFDISTQLVLVDLCSKKQHYSGIRYSDMQEFLKYHIDVFNLIEQDLAISIHDVGYSYNDEDELIIDSSRTKEKCNVCSQFLDIDNECPTGHRQT